MKIVHLTTSLSHSGGGLFYAIAGLARAQRAQGHDVEVIGGADLSFEKDRGEWGDIPLHPFPLGSSYGLHSAPFRDLRSAQPDIVHIHGIWSANSIYGRLATFRGIPTVVSPHGMLDPWILARNSMIKGVHAALFERPLFRRAYVHALNETERDAAIAFMPSLKERIFVVPNGIGEAIPPGGEQERSGTLFLGRLHSKKQTLELIERWNAFALPGVGTLTIAGWGDVDYQAAVVRAAEASPKVEFVGALHGEEKAAAFRRSRFFILPSLSEGLPMAVLEAIQHGCIPIITPECNLPELFRDGIALRMNSGFSDFQAVMAKAAAFSPAEAEGRSDEAAVYARHYAWPTVAKAILDQYREVAHGH